MMDEIEREMHMIDALLATGDYTTRPTWLSWLPSGLVPEKAKTIFALLQERIGRSGGEGSPVDSLMWETGLSEACVTHNVELLQGLGMIRPLKHAERDEYCCPGLVEVQQAKRWFDLTLSRGSDAVREALWEDRWRHRHDAIRQWASNCLDAPGQQILAETDWSEEALGAAIVPHVVYRTHLTFTYIGKSASATAAPDQGAPWPEPGPSSVA